MARPSAVRSVQEEALPQPLAKDKPSAIGVVFDMNAAPKKPRSHDIILSTDKNGVVDKKTYELFSDQGTEMPLDHAMRFIVDKAFKVIGPDGQQIKPVETRKDGGLGALVLEPDQVIATLDELSDKALYRRAKTLPGSEKITDTTSGKKLIDFIVKHESKARAVGVGRGSEGVQRELSKDDLDLIAPIEDG